MPECFRETNEEGEQWMPLEPEEQAEEEDVNERPTNATTRRVSYPPPSGSSSLTRATTASSQSCPKRHDDTNSKLREGLWEHPLSHGWGLFLGHLTNEVWEMEVHIRLGE